MGAAHVQPPDASYLADATEARGLSCRVDLIVKLGSSAEVAAVMSACFDALRAQVGQ